VHGFLALRTLDGRKLADGEMTQITKGDQLIDNLVFRFLDGSIYKDETVFTQKGQFRLLRDHLVETGPSFKQPMDVRIDASSGEVRVRYTEDGQQKDLEQKLELPPDLANGLIFTLLKDLDPSTPRTTVSMLAATPKPRLIKLAIMAVGQSPLASGGIAHKAVDYELKVEIGGLTGLLARVMRKQPKDVHVWILSGEAPAFVKAEGPLYQDGPIWRIELAEPRIP
jgi:hypothetical protein